MFSFFRRLHFEYTAEVSVQTGRYYENAVLPLHSSPAGKKYGRACGELNVTKHVSDTLVRLPLFYGLKDEQQDYIIEQVFKFWRG